jgi:hypothetical protein
VSGNFRLLQPTQIKRKIKLSFSIEEFNRVPPPDGKMRIQFHDDPRAYMELNDIIRDCKEYFENVKDLPFRYHDEQGNFVVRKTTIPLGIQNMNMRMLLEMAKKLKEYETGEK